MGSREAAVSLAGQAIHLVDGPEVGRGLEESWRVL